MPDISTELDAFENSKNGPNFKQSLLTLLFKLGNNDHDLDKTYFDDFYNGCIFRGKCIGTGDTFEEASTSEQRAAIADGTFKNLYIGDYWTISGVNYRIADFNYFYNVGDEACTTNHVVIVPDTDMGSGAMNDSNITTGAYVGSVMYTDSSSVLNVARNTISNKFGDYLLVHRIYLPNTTTNGAESAGAWSDSVADLMSEIMVYGTPIRKNKYDGTFIATSEKSQLALFRLNPLMVNGRITYWLRDVVSSTYFALVNSVGNAALNSASNSFGVRPFFTIKGTK